MGNSLNGNRVSEPSVLGGITLPLGVHGGNARRGNGYLVMATSLAVGATAWALAIDTGESGWILLSPAAPAQSAVSPD